MPLDTSTYNLALLRVDGRRWNELRRVHAQIRTQAAADGSSYLEMGLKEKRPKWCSVDRKRYGRGDKRTLEMQSTVANALSASLHTHLFPHSQINISLHVLSQDGSLLAALINAATLACVDAGIPMTDYVAACTAGSTSTYAANDEDADPLLDLNHQEEQELPGLTVATLGETDRVAVLVCESRVQVSRLEGMLAVGVDGCKQVREILDRVVREKGRRMIQEGTVEKGVGLDDMDLD
ncbi:Exosome non-catalytic core component [Collariella sp. IMI 366227]|nr:Exosome non-catalytic core component [Collariella sp. IMI 366227]